MQIGNPIGLYALLSLIPFIILYLIKPKPIEKIIPSLMFLIKNKKDASRNSFFKKLLRNLVFLMQLIALLLVALTLSYPYLVTSTPITSQNTVIIIDGSASTQTTAQGATRFQRSIDIARNSLEGRISIIAAYNTPEVMLEHGSRTQALVILSALEPKDTESSLISAIYEAESLLDEKQGRIIIISDFISADINEILKLRAIIASKGIDMEFISVFSPAENIGFVNLNIDSQKTLAHIKNFNDQNAEITALLMKESEVIARQTREIPPRATEIFQFETLPGLSTIKISPDDNFPLDDIVYISSPDKKSAEVLLVTNSRSSSLKSALEASEEIDLRVAEPPVVRGIQSAEIIILHKIDPSLILPGTIEEIASEVSRGSTLIITAQEETPDLGINWLLPVEITEMRNNTWACAKVINRFTREFQNNPCFASLSKYFAAALKNSTVSFINADDSSPLLAMSSRGHGSVIYYGIMDDHSDFKTQISYPIFWNELIMSLVNMSEISDYNFRIGEVPNINKVGTYSRDGKTIAVNLLSESESDVVTTKIGEIPPEEFLAANGTEMVKIELIFYFIIAAIALMFLEILYLKSRGDL